MEVERMFELVSGLGEAKSRQDLAAAMTFQHEDMVLETPAFGSVVRGKAANEAALAWFFDVFPDYGVELEGHASDGERLVCWGTVRMTLRPGRLGVTPNGRAAEFPGFLRFTFKDDLIASEYFLFDLAEVCSQYGVSTDEVRRRLFERRAAAAA